MALVTGLAVAEGVRRAPQRAARRVVIVHAAIALAARVAVTA
jgi:hypothetical protein